VKSPVPFLPPAAVLLAAVAIAAATTAQSPTGPQSTGTSPQLEPKVYPAPANLKVLPKNLTGEKIHEIMEQWSAALGTQCNSCHTEDLSHIDPNGHPQLNFVDDSKGMKRAARVMYTMTEKINTDYTAKIDSSGVPVTCGTCHRGHLGPEPFVTTPKDRTFAPQSLSSSGEKNSPSQENANQ
jgi:hypothetical protein